MKPIKAEYIPHCSVFNYQHKNVGIRNVNITIIMYLITAGLLCKQTYVNEANLQILRTFCTTFTI
jgi:hypothetical protein